MHPWFLSLGGGVLIGLAASVLLLFSGRISGISGIVGGLFSAPRDDQAWRGSFVLGLLAGGAVLVLLAPGVVRGPEGIEWGTIAVAGLMVGFGTRLGGGCTSGHGVCGLARLSVRSAVATACFMASGVATATWAGYLRGPLP